MKILLIGLLFSGITACTPVYICKATTTMDGRCTDLDGCTMNPHDVVPAWRL